MREEIEQTRAELGDTVAALVSAAQEAAPESASDARQRLQAFAKQNSLVLSALATFGLAMMIGRRTGR